MRIILVIMLKTKRMTIEMTLVTKLKRLTHIFLPQLPAWSRQKHLGHGGRLHRQGCPSSRLLRRSKLLFLKPPHCLPLTIWCRYLLAGDANDHQAQQDGGGRYGREGDWKRMVVDYRLRMVVVVLVEIEVWLKKWF